jgi:chromosome segregation ATPase
MTAMGQSAGRERAKGPGRPLLAGEDGETAERGVAARSGVCGFSRCRRPLPMPGPQGGRPYAYCRNREWPGGMTCKQLAGAEHALRTALDDEGAPAALATAVGVFAESAEAVREPLALVVSALDSVRGSLEQDLISATERAERAEHRAVAVRAEAVGAIEQADERVMAAEGARQEAERAQADADRRAVESAAAQAVAEAEAAESTERVRLAQLAQAGSKSAADELRTRVEVAEGRAQAERDRAAHLAADVAGLREQLATALARVDAGHDALEAAHAHGRNQARLAAKRQDQLAQEGRSERARADDAEARQREQAGAHEQQLTRLYERLGDAEAMVRRQAHRIGRLHASLSVAASDADDAVRRLAAGLAVVLEEDQPH